MASSSILQPGHSQAITLRPPRWERLLAGVVAAIGCIVVATAIRIDPYDTTGRPRVRGTHLQLGLAPCLLLSHAGYPCPSCGMTTSVSLFFHGDVIAACRANWAGVVIGSTGVAAIAWLGLLAAGMPRRPSLSAEATIVALTVLGAGATTVRYMVALAFAIAHSTC